MKQGDCASHLSYHAANLPHSDYLGLPLCLALEAWWERQMDKTPFSYDLFMSADAVLPIMLEDVSPATALALSSPPHYDEDLQMNLLELHDGSFVVAIEDPTVQARMKTQPFAPGPGEDQ